MVKQYRMLSLNLIKRRNTSGPDSKRRCLDVCPCMDETAMDVEFEGIHTADCPSHEDMPNSIARHLWNYTYYSSLLPMFPTSLHDDIGIHRLMKCKKIIDYTTQHIEECNQMYHMVSTLIRYWLVQFIPLIVGHDRYAANKAEYHRVTGSLPAKIKCFTITYRQAGKTTALAIVIAAVMCCADSGKLIKVYAKNQPQATNIVSEIKKVLRALPSFLMPTIKPDNATSVGVIADDNDICLVEARPGRLDSVRGDVARAIVVDEWCFVDPEFFNKHIRSLMTHKRRILTCISTPAPLSSPMGMIGARIMANPELYPDTKFFFFSLVCEKHRRANKMVECICNFGDMPPWRDPVDLWLTMKQLGTDDETTYMSELLGEPCENAAVIFDPLLITRTFTSVPPENIIRMSTPPQGNTIYVSVDPACAGPSDMGIVSFYYSTDPRLGDHPIGLTLLGMETVNTQRTMMDQNWQFIVDHIAHLRKLYSGITPFVQIVPIVEAQGSQMTANTFCGMIVKHCMPCELVFGTKGKRESSYGVPTTADKKLLMVHRLQALLSDNQILIDEKFYTSGRRTLTGGSNKGSTGKRVLQFLAAQLRVFADDRRGGMHGKRAGQNDDLAMALMIGCFWSAMARIQQPNLTMAY